MNNLTVGIGADISNLQAGIASATSSISGFVSGANSRLQSFGDSISDIGQKLSIGLSIPLGLLGKQALENGAGLESLKMGLKSIEEQQYGAGKSAEYAASRFSEFIEIAKLPSVGLKEAISMSIGLRSVGFSADEAKREILAFGNTLALVGKGKNELNGVALQLQQLSGKSSGFGADLRIIKEYAPQVGAALLQAFGTLDTEAIAKTGVTGKQVIEKITTELEKLPKAGAGLKTAMENVADAIFITTGRIGEALNKSMGLTTIFNSIGDSLTSLATAFESLSPTTQKFIGITAGLLVIVPPILMAVGGIISSLSALGGGLVIAGTFIKGFVLTSIVGMGEFVTAVTISLAEATTAFEFFSGVLTLNPIGAVIAGIVLLSGALYGLSKILVSTTKEVSNLQNAENELNAVKKANYGTFDTETAKTTALVGVIKSNARSLDEKKTALNQLIAISPKYFEGLTIEKIKAGEADEAIKKYTKSIYENAVTKGAEAKISKLAEQLTTEKDSYDEANSNLNTYIEERKKLGVKLTENDLRKKVKGGIFEKFQVSSNLVNELDEAKAKVEKTKTALEKMSEFVALRTIKVEGGKTDETTATKPLTKKQQEDLEIAERKAGRLREKGVKHSEDLSVKLAEFKANVIDNEVQKAVDGENAKYEKEKLSIERTKANVQVKHATLVALESSHQKAILDIKAEAQKKESEFIINSFTNQIVKERALEQLSFEDKLKNVPKIIQGKANQHKAIELLEIEHQAKMREIEGKGGIREITPSSIKLGGIGSKLIDGSDGFGKVGTLTNPIEQISNNIKNSIPKLQSTLAEVTGVFMTANQRMRLQWAQLGTMGRPSVKLLSAMLKDSLPTISETFLSMAKTIDNGAKSMLGGFGKVIGAMSVGKAGISDVGNMLLEGFGGILVSLGEQMIASSSLLASAASAIALALTPAGAGLALAAGIGLVALGSAISSSATSSSGGTSGSSSYAQNYSSGSGSYGGGSQFNGGGERNQVFTINLTGKLTADGNDLSANLDRTIRQKARTYGGK